MKKHLIIILIVLSLPISGQTDFLFFGENRAEIPGPHITNSFYSDNPANTAYTSFNSVAAGFIFYTQNQEFLFNPGLFYTLNISNFRMLHIRNESTIENSGSPLYRTRDLIGIQLSASLSDLALDLPFDLAVGVQANREYFEDRNDLHSAVNSKKEILTLDFGLDFRSSDLAVGAIIKRGISFGDTNSFKSPMEIGLELDKNFFYDIKTHFYFCYYNGYGETDFSVRAGLSRSFFSNSLTTGFAMTTYADLSSEILMPYYKYSMTLTYMFNNNDGLVPIEKGSSIDNVLSGTYINFRGSMQVSNIAGNEYSVPIIALNFGKTF